MFMALKSLKSLLLFTTNLCTINLSCIIKYYIILCIKKPYLWVLSCISPACTDSPAFEAPIHRLTHFRVVGTSFTVARKGAILIIIVTGVAECYTTLCSAAVSLRIWPAIKEVFIDNNLNL